MNLLLLRKKDLESGTAVVSGERALHIHSVLRSKPGDRIKAGLLNGNIGSVRIVSVEKNKVVVDDPLFTTPPPDPLPVALAVALPRPQSFKKTLHFIVSSGIRRAIFFHSARVEKSYWNSMVLNQKSLRAEIDEALEQGVDTIDPELIFFRKFHEFIEYSKGMSGIQKIVAHPVLEQKDCPPVNGKILLAIGPEGGFIPAELDSLVDAGFRKYGFGQHILRVEFACAFITGRLTK